MDDHFQQFWQDPKHWRLHFVYFCRQDPRIVVPERHKWMGWTFNYAHSSAYLLTIAIILAMVVPSLKALLTGRVQDLPITICFSVAITITLVFVVSRVGRQH